MILLMMTLSYGVPVREGQKRVFLAVRYSLFFLYFSTTINAYCRHSTSAASATLIALLARRQK